MIAYFTETFIPCMYLVMTIYLAVIAHHNAMHKKDKLAAIFSTLGALSFAFAFVNEVI